MKQLNIFKIGGNILEDETRMIDFAQSISQISGLKIIVHGGGRTASTISTKLGIQPKMIEGRRITDSSTLEVVTMVYAGLLNKKLVAQLQKHKVQSLGLSGADLNSISAFRREVKSIDYGFVGDIKGINSEVLNLLLEQNICPVFCAITHDEQGQLLNTNADTIASMLSESMSKLYDVSLFYCFEKAGVLLDANDDSSLIPQLDYQHYQQLKLEGHIHLGMIPKLDNAFYAHLHGAQSVHICHTNALQNFYNLIGTKIC